MNLKAETPKKGGVRWSKLGLTKGGAKGKRDEKPLAVRGERRARNAGGQKGCQKTLMVRLKSTKTANVGRREKQRLGRRRAREQTQLVKVARQLKVTQEEIQGETRS